MIKKLLIVLIVLAAIFTLFGDQREILKQSWSYGGPNVPILGIPTGSIDIIAHNYLWYNETPFVRVYDIRINLPFYSVSKSVHHKDLADFIQSLPPTVQQELDSRGFNPPPLYPFEQ